MSADEMRMMSAFLKRSGRRRFEVLAQEREQAMRDRRVPADVVRLSLGDRDRPLALLAQQRKERMPCQSVPAEEVDVRLRHAICRNILAMRRRNLMLGSSVSADEVRLGRGLDEFD